MKTIGRIVTGIMIFGMLTNLFGCSGESATWQQMTLSRSHMNAALCFYLHVFPNEAGRMTVTGYLIDKDGTEYSLESGIVLSEEAKKHLRDMKLDELANKRKKLRPTFHISDETVTKLILTYPGGKEKEKDIPDEVLEAIFTVILKEFKNQSITSFEKITLRIIGMRYDTEYEIICKSSEAELLLYTNGSDERKLEKSVVTDTKTVLELLNSCHVLLWNGFDGAHPENTKDGETFEFIAVVNEGYTIKAQGSANYPDGYHEWIRSLDRILSGNLIPE